MILRILTEGGLKRSSPNEDLTNEYLLGAREALDAGLTLVEAFPKIAYEQAHESIRKAFTAFLNAEGLRPTSEAGHHAVVIEAVDAQLGHVMSALIKRVLVIRRNRNALQYPQAVTVMDSDQAADALGTASDILRGLENLISSGNVPVFR